MKTGIPSKFDGKCYLCNVAYSSGTLVEGYDSTDKEGNPKKRYGHVACVNAHGNQAAVLQQVQPAPRGQVNTAATDALVDALLRIRVGVDEAISIIRASAP